MPDSTRARLGKLIFITWFLTLDLIMFGAFVRLTDAGLGCPDWPGCYGSVTPVGAMQSIKEAANALPDGPVTLPKAWIEMIHRYVGAGLGLLIISIAWLAWRHRQTLKQSPALASFIVLLVCVQGAFGAWTVTHRLMPLVVTSHLVLGMFLLACMTWLAARFKHHATVAAVAQKWLPWVSVGVLILFIQIALGGWVSTNYAALACMDFPTCNGQWLPVMDVKSGYSLVRALGQMPSGEMISQHALTAIHWVHRNFAFVVFAYLGVLAIQLRAYQGLRGPASLVLVLLVAQLLTGLTTIFFQWPIVIAVLHNGGAAGLVIATVTLAVRLGTISNHPLKSMS
jgi:cytochrome c oxidase assembly protein subunit 15